MGDQTKYRNVGIGVFVWELHVRNVGMGMWEPEYRNQVWEHGSVGTRVWEPTYWNGNMGTTVLEWGSQYGNVGIGIWVWEWGITVEYGNVGTTVWERGYWNHTNLAKHILTVPPAHVLLHGLGVFFLGQFE